MSTSRSRRYPLPDLDFSFEPAAIKRCPCCTKCRHHLHVNVPMKGGHLKICPYASGQCDCDFCVKSLASQLKRIKATNKRKAQSYNQDDGEDDDEVQVVGTKMPAVNPNDPKEIMKASLFKKVKLELRSEDDVESEDSISPPQLIAQDQATWPTQPERNQVWSHDHVGWTQEANQETFKRSRIDDYVQVQQCPRTVDLQEMTYPRASVYQQHTTVATGPMPVQMPIRQQYMHGALPAFRCSTHQQLQQQPYHSNQHQHQHAHLNSPSPMNAIIQTFPIVQTSSPDLHAYSIHHPPAIISSNHLGSYQQNHQNQSNFSCVQSNQFMVNTQYNNSSNNNITSNNNINNVYNNNNPNQEFEFARPATPIQRYTPAIPAVAPVLPVLDYDPFESFDEGLFEMEMLHRRR